MELSEYFATQCRATGVLLRSTAPTLKKLTSGKKGKNQVGVSATYVFDKFKFNIIYTEQGHVSYAQQSIWLSFSLDCEPSVPFSVYDILAYIRPLDFNCYTYTYVDSKELMQDCFGEINGLLLTLVPKLCALLENGVDKNKLLLSQKESINRYFGDNVLETGEMLGGAGDKIIDLMLKNYFDAQIECAVIGAQALFYEGKTEKALKKLKKSKFRTQYHENLIKYMENGGKIQYESPIVKAASLKNGAKRHGGGIKGALKYLSLSVAFTLLLSLLAFGVFYVLCAILFRDSILVSGIWENAVLFPGFCMLLGSSIALNLINRRKKKDKDDKKAVHSPKPAAFTAMFLKCFTIFAECVVVLGIITSLNSTTVFYENSFKYSEEDFPLSQNECYYDAVDCFIYVEGYEYDGKFQEDPHICAVTKSGTEIDLYNSTCFSADEFKENCSEILEKYSIDFKSQKIM